jgi:hypothetical protein
VLQTHGVRPRREGYIYGLGFSALVPYIQHQLAVHPQPGTVIMEDRKAVCATIEVEGPCPTAGEVIWLDKRVWRIVVPFEVNGRLVAGDHWRAAEGFVVEVFCLPVRVTLQEDRKV